MIIDVLFLLYFFVLLPPPPTARPTKIGGQYKMQIYKKNVLIVVFC